MNDLCMNVTWKSNELQMIVLYKTNNDALSLPFQPALSAIPSEQTNGSDA